MRSTSALGAAQPDDSDDARALANQLAQTVGPWKEDTRIQTIPRQIQAPSQACLQRMPASFWSQLGLTRPHPRWALDVLVLGSPQQAMAQTTTKTPCHTAMKIQAITTRTSISRAAISLRDFSFLEAARGMHQRGCASLLGLSVSSGALRRASTPLWLGPAFSRFHTKKLTRHGRINQLARTSRPGYALRILSRSLVALIRGCLWSSPMPHGCPPRQVYVTLRESQSSAFITTRPPHGAGGDSPNAPLGVFEGQVQTRTSNQPEVEEAPAHRWALAYLEFSVLWLSFLASGAKPLCL